MRVLRILLAAGPALLLAAAGLIHPHFLTANSAPAWQHLHAVLLPVFPMLALGIVIPLWGRPGRGLVGLATVVAWSGAFVYAVFYTGLDLVAGFAAGTVARNTDPAGDLGAAVQPLFAAGDKLGHIGVYGLAAATVGMSVALLLRVGVLAVLPGVTLIASSYSFFDSHIFWPRGVITMLVIAASFAFATWLSDRAASPQLDLTPFPEIA